MIPATYVRIANFPCLSFKMHVHVFTEEFLPSNLLVRSTSTFYRYKLISSIFDKCSILEQMIWLWNHASHTKVHFNECVANVGHNHLGPPRLWRLLEAKKNDISVHTLALLLNVQFIPQRQFCLPKIHQEILSVMTLSFLSLISSSLYSK